MTDLRKAAEMALAAMEYHIEQTRPITRTSEAITVLRAALAQPEQEPEPWMGVSDNPYASDAGCNEPNGRAMRWHNKLQLMQPEPEPVGWLYESRAGVRVFHPASDDKRFQADWEAAQQHPEAHKMTPLYTQSPQRLQSFAQDWDAPGMEAYDDPPLAPSEPTRSQQMRDAGYTRRPRQLPKEDEQEPVAWINEHGHIDGGLDAILDPTGWTPLYAAPPQRQPLTGEKLEAMYEDYVTHGDIVRAVERAHGIGVEE